MADGKPALMYAWNVNYCMPRTDWDNAKTRPELPNARQPPGLTFEEWAESTTTLRLNELEQEFL